MILAIGEILFDTFPEYRRLGGAPFNFACHLKRMGFDMHLVSRVGKDDDGREILARVADVGLPPEDIQVDGRHPTGEAVVGLGDEGAPAFDLPEGVAYDFIAGNDAVRRLLNAGPDLVYFGSLIQRTRRGRDELHRMLAACSECSRFFYDMNLRPGCREADILERSLDRADILKLNGEELETAGRLLGFTEKGPLLVQKLMEAFALETVAVTRGGQGSEIFSNGKRFAAGPFAVDQIRDTVGAGDAYAAFMAAGILRGEPWERIVRAAARFAAKICTIAGAIPAADGDFYHLWQDMNQGNVHGR